MDWQKTFFDTDGREQDSSTFDSSKRDELHCVKGKVYECNHRIKRVLHSHERKEASLTYSSSRFEEYICQ